MTHVIDTSLPMDLSLNPDSREAELIQQLYCLLKTDQGSVPCYREYGVDSEWLHRPINVARSAYSVAIMQAVKRFLPEVRIDSLRFTVSPLHPDRLYPVMEVTFLE